MSGERTCGLLLRLYPAGWRAGYGEELEALILESSGGSVPWRARLDVARAAGRERLRAAGLAGDHPPAERLRAGVLLVLCAWAVFVVAGSGVQKLSEHWQQAMPPGGGRDLARAAFDALVAGAGLAGVLALVGIAATLPAVARLLRAGGWPSVRRRALAAAVLTAVAVPVTAALVVWAHGLTSAQRDGHDAGYAALFVVWAVLLVAALAAWTAAAVAIARRLRLSAAVLRLEAGLATGVAVAMGVMTAATATWWAAVAHVAPGFLAGRPADAAASPLEPRLVVCAIAMLAATGLAARGAERALRAVPALRPGSAA